MEYLDYQCNGCRKHLPQMGCEHEAQWRDLEIKLRKHIGKEIKQISLVESKALGFDAYFVTSKMKRAAQIVAEKGLPNDYKP